MNCTGCGAPLKKGAEVCGACGKKTQLRGYAAQPERAIIEKTSNRGLKIAVIAVSCALVLCIAAMGTYFGIRASSLGKTICSDCGASFRGEGTLCERCMIEALNAKDCIQCTNKHNTEGFLCEDCLDEINIGAYADRYYCYVCNETIEQEEITYINPDGFVFCGDCDSDYVCDGCERKFKYPEIVYEDGREMFCAECYEDLVVAECTGCHKDILYDVDYKKVEGNFYCMDCYKTLSRGKCIGCGETIYLEDDYYGKEGSMCCENCYSGICRICDTVLVGRDYKKVDGRYYCYDCYGGKGYIGECRDCGDKVFEENAVEINGYYYCHDCGNPSDEI